MRDSHLTLMERCAPASPSGQSDVARVETFKTASNRLRGLGSRLHGKTGSVSVGEIVDALGPAAIGMVLIVLTLPALIPIPGPFGLLFGTILMIVSGQLMFGARRLWLPAVIRQRSLPISGVARVAAMGVPLLARVEAWLKPRRLLPLTSRLARIALSVPLVILAFAIALPIPFGNVLPALSVIALALGIVVRDGVAIIVGFGLSAVAGLWTAAMLFFGGELIGWGLAQIGW